jgi:putative FmdB family regulatory protein
MSLRPPRPLRLCVTGPAGPFGINALNRRSQSAKILRLFLLGRCPTMPTYEYRCPEGHSFELFQKMTDKPRAKCPTCGRMASRQMSAGAGLHFKGSGFYITDYGKDGKGPRKDTGSASSETGSASEKPAAEASKSPAPAEKAEKPKGKGASKKAKE